jgi:hypothetical protein
MGHSIACKQDNTARKQLYLVAWVLVSHTKCHLCVFIIGSTDKTAHVKFHYVQNSQTSLDLLKT